MESGRARLALPTARPRCMRRETRWTDAYSILLQSLSLRRN